MRLPLLLPLLALTAARDLNRERREATPLFGNVVDAVTSPFRGFLNLVGFTGASGEKEPEKKPSNSYGAPSYKPAPSYHAPAPAYHAPAPTYHATPSYQAPAPAPAYHAPAPSYSAPAPVVVHHAPKPEIHVLPAPDLSHGPGTYGSPAAPSVDTYGSPAAPSYSAPALDTYGSAASPPVYTPTSNDPAPVDVVTTVKLIEPPAAVEVIHPITNVPLAPLDPVVVVQEADVVDLRTAVPEEARQPKAINGDSGKLNQVESKPSKTLQGEFVPVQSELIIDLTENKDNVADVEIEVPAPPPAFEGLAPAPAPAFEELAIQTTETTVAPTEPTVKTTVAPPEPTTVRVIHFTREPISSPGDTFFRTANSGFSEPVQQSAQLRIETPAPTSAPVDLPATAPAFVETPAPAVAQTVVPSETPAPAPAFEESPAPAPAFTTTVTAASTTEASSTQVTEVQTDATTTLSPVTPLLPGENLRAAVTVIDLTEETPKEALDYEVLALVDDIDQPIKTTIATTEATEAPVVRKVFFEIVDDSVEKEPETTAAPTVAAIPEAISTDPVFQVQLSFLATNPLSCSGDCKRRRGKRAAEERFQGV